MDREKLIGQAADYYLSRQNADVAVTMADFTLEILAERDAEIQRLVTTLEKCEATAELFAGTLSPKAGGTIARDLLSEIREALGK